MRLPKDEERSESLGVRLTHEQILRLQEEGNRQDILKGGLFDTRSGCVNIWVSPEDQPVGYDTPIDPDNEYPRDYVGAIRWNWDASGQHADLEIEATPYEVFRKMKRTEMLSEERWTNIMLWVRTKAMNLITYVKMLPDVAGTHCPFCNFYVPSGHLMNELVEHMTKAHSEIKMEGFVLGNPGYILSEGKRYELRPALRGEGGVP